MRVEGHEADVAGLRILHVPEDVSGHVVVHEGRIAEGDQPTLDLTRKVAAKEEIHGADRRERDPAGDPSWRAVVQKAFLDPSPVAELLRHRSTRIIQERTLRNRVDASESGARSREVMRRTLCSTLIG